MQTIELQAADNAGVAASLFAAATPVPQTTVLVDCYANAPRRIERITPADVQARRIGHFGFFREQFQSTLWQRTAQLLHGFHTPQETRA